MLAFVFGAEELFAFVHAWFDCPFAFLPVGRADFAVLFEELEGLDHSESFVDRASQGQIVDDLMAYDSILVDQDIGGFEVTVDDSCGMRFLQSRYRSQNR